ncbi:glycosyltransferase family 4 protein [Nocardioides nitrophenolicus]|uniref:glycosyltransferase family 4 protein n=1 Tax=Nocardioides nitrophenolicus TaxID=60489 RepID=UPI0019568E61|nr:glycosyltransferase family 4 protein [Nocardioides nitrophenolicus]MBM7520315.1 glycosyltransferase involved in cell wall biosynthesis [Nocardioides nitrophenolicus]
MRILTVIPELGAGGAEVVALTLARAATADGHHSRIASAPGFRVAEATAAGIAHTALPTMGRRPRDLLRAVVRLRRLPPPDLVHAHNPKAALLCRLAFGHRAPLLVTLHGVADHELGTAVRILRRAADHVVVVSPHLRERLLVHGFPAYRVSVVPNGVDRLPAYPRQRARAELGIAPDEVVALCPARLVEQKRHDLLVEAWAALDRPPLLLLAGDGPRRPDVTAAIARHGLRDRVRLLGERADLPRLLAASDLLTLATDWEGLPIAVLEALGAGLPVVASDVPGITDQFGDAVHVVPPGSAADLAAGLRAVLVEPALRARLSAAGTFAFDRRFAADPMIARYRDLQAAMTGSSVRIPTTTGVSP